MQRARHRHGKRRPRPLRKVVLIILICIILLTAAVCAILLNSKGTLPPRNYPMEYRELIEENASKQNVPPAYIASIIMAESDYDPTAVSSVNAQGLMQILPDTATWLATKFDEVYVEGSLFDPSTNIKYGAWYLGYLLNRFSRDMRLATAAYHAGQGTVDKWLKNPEYSLDGQTLTVIPGEKTSRYVERVLKYYKEYDLLYAKEDKSLT